MIDNGLYKNSTKVDVIMELKTERLIMRTNIQFDRGHLVLPSKKSGIDLQNLQRNIAEDGGFIFYDDKNNLVCHIGIRTDRKPCEITYGTQVQFRRNGYMQEALSFLLRLFFENGLAENVYALICNNPVSEHILTKNGFIKEHRHEDGGDWFILDTNF